MTASVALGLHVMGPITIQLFGSAVLPLFSHVLQAIVAHPSSPHSLRREHLGLGVDLSLVCLFSISGKGILSGHADGTIVRYFFDDEGSGESQVRGTEGNAEYQSTPFWFWLLLFGSGPPHSLLQQSAVCSVQRRMPHFLFPSAFLDTMI